MEEYLNLYHQKLWEVANDNIVGVFINPLILSLVLFFYPIIVYHFVIEKKQVKLLLMMSSIPVIFGLSCLIIEYRDVYNQIVNSTSDKHMVFFLNYQDREGFLGYSKNDEEIQFASVDGKLHEKDIIMFVNSNVFYTGLLDDLSAKLPGGHQPTRIIPIVLVGYTEKDEIWESIDIRISPGDNKEDFEKFSKLIHIKKEDTISSKFISDFQELYQTDLQMKEKNY